MTGQTPYILFGLNINSILPDVVAVMMFISVMLVWHNLRPTNPQKTRARVLARHRIDLDTLQSRMQQRIRRNRHFDYLSGILHHLKILQSKQNESIRKKLLHAGLRSQEAVFIYLILKIFISILCLLIIFLAYYMIIDNFFLSYYIFLTLFVIFLFFAPDIYLLNTAMKRRQAIQKALPDSLDLMVICAEAGLSLDATLHRVSEELAVSAPELSEELGIVSIELNFLPERRLALHNLGRRVDLQSVRGIINTLIQTEKYGTPLSQSLRVLSAEFREYRILCAEEKAARLPAILTVPMIIFILPTLFIVLIGPAILDIYDSIIK